MSASHYKLKNIVVIIDKNNFQQTGSSSEIMNTADLASKWRSFNWDVFEIDGHDIQSYTIPFLHLKTKKTYSRYCKYCKRKRIFYRRIIMLASFSYIKITV